MTRGVAQVAAAFEESDAIVHHMFGAQQSCSSRGTNRKSPTNPKTNMKITVCSGMLVWKEKPELRFNFWFCFVFVWWSRSSFTLQHSGPAPILLFQPFPFSVLGSACLSSSSFAYLDPKFHQQLLNFAIRKRQCSKGHIGVPGERFW